MAVSDETSNDRGWMYSGWKRGKPTDEWYETTKEFLDFAFSAQANVVHNGKIKCPCADCRNYITKDRDDVELDLCGFGFKRNYSVWTEHGEERVHRTDHVVVDDKRSNVKPSNSMSCQALLRRNQYLEKRNKRNGSYFKVLFANAGLDVPEDLEDDFMEDTDHLHLSCRSTENGGTPLTPSSHAEDQIGTPRKPTCGWMVSRVVVPSAKQSSNPRFDVCVLHSGGIFFQWEATFPSTARRLW